MNDLLYSAAFVLCVAAFATGPLIAPTQHTPRQHQPAWALSPAQARRFARHTRQRDIRP
jgi:hypothetical protein